MRTQSYLIQDTVNRILAKIGELEDERTAIPKDNTLAKMLDVSRTTIRTALIEIQRKGIIEVDGNAKILVRKPQNDDYFNTQDQASSKEEIIERYFLDRINQGKLLPGDKFSELELAKGSGCNTITVREFLIKFSRFGLIEKNPRAKWQMVEFDERFATELIEFRRLLEMNSLTKLMAKPKDDPVWAQLGQLLKQHHEILENVEERYPEFSELDRRLHHTIQEASGNRFFMQYFDVVALICHHHYQWDKGDALERNRIALQEHIDIISHLLAHNTTGVITAMEIHLNTAKNTLFGSAQGLK